MKLFEEGKFCQSVEDFFLGEDVVGYSRERFKTAYPTRVEEAESGEERGSFDESSEKEERWAVSLDEVQVGEMREGCEGFW